MEWLNIAAYVPVTEAEGPGRRAALWVQGCIILCPGCCNPHFLKLTARQLVSSDDLVEEMRRSSATYDLEGVTLLGGEPFLQARGLAVVARAAQSLGLSVMVFSGYTYEDLEALQLPGTADLLANCDVLVDGPYLADLPETHRQWAGSANQRFHYLSNRYDSAIESYGSSTEEIDVHVGLEGEVAINGWPVAISTQNDSRSHHR